ncbi:hypothetical protein [Streptomyces europaeiscabiei]|uniref:hypothetical protein n=1 Tax=Streptomyces europaeiscabiei TaxID=146819 RepID=UPI0029C9FAF0|nr:hypothetical protein [Streptomyces europaeiscabiei]
MSFLGVLAGLSVVLLPGGPSVAVADSCADRLTEQLECWAEVIKDGPVVITLDEPLAYEEVEERQRHDIETLRRDRYPLVVRVQKDKATGEGGTALLVLAEGRLVHPEARIDRLRPGPMDALREAGLCIDREPLCGLIEREGDKSEPLDGKALIDAGFAADHTTHVEAIGPVQNDRKPSASTSPGKSAGQGGEERDDPDAPTGGEAAGYSGAAWTAFWMGLLLALLLLAFVIVIRRSRGPVAVGHRAPSPGRGVGGPARAAPAHAARGGGGGAGSGAGSGGGSGAGDESTTRLRVAPAPRYGRQVGARPAHARTAVVRTELHPQGYVEVDRVLRRAVWAEPGRPPPAPGGLVDVTDARERDSDVLYAFPPTAARHAKGTPR